MLGMSKKNISEYDVFFLGRSILFWKLFFFRCYYIGIKLRIITSLISCI